MGMKAKTALDKAKEAVAEWQRKVAECNSPYNFGKLVEAQRKVKSIIQKAKGTQTTLIK